MPATDPVSTTASTGPAQRSADDVEAIAALHRLVLASLDDDQAVDTISIPLAAMSALSLLLMLFIAIKLVGVIRVVHGMDWFRGALVVSIAGVVYQAYEALVWMPFFATVIAMKS